MFDDFNIRRESVTPEFVLKILRDEHRQQCQYDSEADPDVTLSFDTSVDDWCQACDLLPWWRVADAYNVRWGFHCSRDEWFATLEPAEVRTLRDACNLLARHAKLPQARPAVLLGAPCVTGGTFLTIRAILREAGADARHIAPSTPLESYSRRHVEAFLGPISWLSPGALPPIKIHHPIYDLSLWGAFIGLLSLIVAACASLPRVAIIGILVFLASYGMNWFAACRLGPCCVEFGELKTFRDLATVVARHARV